MAVFEDEKVDVFEGFEDHTDASNMAHPTGDDADDKSGESEAGSDDQDDQGDDQHEDDVDDGSEDDDGDEFADEDTEDTEDDAEEGDEFDEDDDTDTEDGESDEDEASGDDDGDGSEPHKKNKTSPQQRINQMRKQVGDADRRADASDQRAGLAEARITELEKKLTGDSEDGNDERNTNASKLEKPDLTDTKKYPYGELDSKYQEDLADYRFDKRAAEHDQKREEKEQASQAEVDKKVWHDKYEEKISDGIDAYDDFEEVVVKGADNNKFPLTPETAMMVLDSPVGHHVAYKIATSPKLAARMAQMSHVDQAKQFGRLEARFTTKKPKNPKPPGTPPPPRRSKGRTGARKFDAKEGSFEDFEKQINAQEARKHRK